MNVLVERDAFSTFTVINNVELECKSKFKLLNSTFPFSIFALATYLSHEPKESFLFPSYSSMLFMAESSAFPIFSRTIL